MPTPAPPELHDKLDALYAQIVAHLPELYILVLELRGYTSVPINEWVASQTFTRTETWTEG